MHQQQSWLRMFIMTLLAVLLVALLVVGVVATTVGIQASREQPEPPATLTTTIRTRTLTDDITGTLETFPSATITVGAEGTVTRSGIAAGVTLQEGGVISVVDERPILFMQGAVPMWRTLAPGTHGDDVRQLQDALMRIGYTIFDESGVYGDSTAFAVAQYLAALGYEAVDASNTPLKADDWKHAALPKQQLVFAPSPSVLATTACGVAGQQLTGTLCTLETTERDYVIALSTADVPDATALEGAAASIPTSDGILNATVGKRYNPTQRGNAGSSTTSSGSASANEGTAPANGAGTGSSTSSGNNLVYLSLENLDMAKLQQDSPTITTGTLRVTVTRTAGNTDALTIESSALRQDGATTWVLTNDGKHVDVKTGLCVKGICEISGTGLTDGTVIALPTAGTSNTDAPARKQ